MGHLIEVSNPDAPFLRNKTLCVKLSGDGTNVGKRLHLINFTFTLLDEGSSVHSSQGNHLLAILKEPEKYDTLKTGLEDIRKEVENLKTLEHSGIQFTVNYFLGGDSKFLAIVVGILTVPVPHTLAYGVKYRTIRDMMLKSGVLCQKLQKVHERLKKISVWLKVQSRKEFNVSNTPPHYFQAYRSLTLLSIIYTFLRVCDVLIDLLIIRLCFEDSIDKVKKFTKFDSLKYKHVYAYQQFVSVLVIPGFEFYIVKRQRHSRT